MLIFTLMISSAGRGFPQWVELHRDDMDRFHPLWPLPPPVSGQRPVQGQTERHHLEKHAAAELPPTPPHPSISVQQPDKEGGAGRGWQLDDGVTTSVS